MKRLLDEELTKLRENADPYCGSQSDFKIACSSIIIIELLQRMIDKQDGEKG